MAESTTHAAAQKSEGMWSAASCFFAASTCGLWGFIAFRALVETVKMIEIFKQFDAKMPLVTQAWLRNHQVIGVGSCLVVLVLLVKEFLPMNATKKMALNSLFLLLGCLLFTFSHWALSAPMTAIVQSLMGGGGRQ